MYFKVLSWEGLMGYMFFLSTVFSMTISAILLILMRHIFGRRNKSNLFLFSFTFLIRIIYTHLREQCHLLVDAIVHSVPKLKMNISWLLYCVTNGLVGFYLVNCSPGRYLEGNENVCKGNLTLIAMILANSFMCILTFFNVSLILTAI